MSHLPKCYLLSIDCEATGLSKFTDQIVEVGLTIHELDQTSHTIHMVSEFRELVYPDQVQMSDGATKVTHITMDQLVGKRRCGDVLQTMSQHIQEHCTDLTLERFLLTYNGHTFDLPLIVAELTRSNMCSVQFFRSLCITRTVDMLPWCRLHLDTTRLIRKADGKCSYRLGDVYQRICGKPLEGAHGALQDCAALAELMSFEDFFQLHTDLVNPTSEKYALNPMQLVRTILIQLKMKTKEHKRKRVRTLLDMMPRKRT